MMKKILAGLFLGSLLASCGKEEPKSAEAKADVKAAPAVAATPKPSAEKKPPPAAPQGKLPQMDPEKARFIAVPSTPKDKGKAAPEVKKAEAKPVEVKPATPANQTPEVKKAGTK